MTRRGLGDEGRPRSPLGPLEGLGNGGGLAGDRRLDPAAFTRGLSVGVLVGAAVAGLGIWRRWRRLGVSEERTSRR
jgi:hypothetical protein